MITDDGKKRQGSRLYFRATQVVKLISCMEECCTVASPVYVTIPHSRDLDSKSCLTVRLQIYSCSKVQVASNRMPFNCYRIHRGPFKAIMLLSSA